MTNDYNPYKIVLSILQDELNLENIPLITNKKDSVLQSATNEIPDEGLDIDKLKVWLLDYQRSSFKKKRTIKQYSGYEILQCLRRSFYNRVGAKHDERLIAMYPFSTIKAVMGNIVEKLIMSMYNQTTGIKLRNGVRLIWKMDEDIGTLYPFNGEIDGLSYDDSLLIDVKFTNEYNYAHTEQCLLYAWIYEQVNRKECFKAVEVLYVNSDMNALTIKRTVIDSDVRDNIFPKIKERILYYDSCLRNNTLPNTDLNKCNFCPYANLCNNKQLGDEINLNDEDNIQSLQNKSFKGNEKNKGTEIKMNNHPTMKILL